MIYKILANYYDDLIFDATAYRNWSEFVQQHSIGKDVLEMACGNGNLSIELAKVGYLVDAFDNSEEMVLKAKQKDKEQLVHFFCHDMRNFQLHKQYSQILCFCDSINYCQNKQEFEDVVACVDQHLKPGGVFLFDIHSMDRIYEFQEEFHECGHINTIDYEWIIKAEQQRLYQTFIFYTNQVPEVEYHQQYIFTIEEIISVLDAFSFEVSIYTDFLLEGIQFGEKYFFVAKKRGV